MKVQVLGDPDIDEAAFTEIESNTRRKTEEGVVTRRKAERFER